MEDKHPNGTYVSVTLAKESQDALFDWVKSNKISNPVDPESYHATVVYSRKGIPEAKKEKIPVPLTAKIIGWELFDTRAGSSCLVARIECKELDDLHNTYMKKYGATYDFPDYKPHVTVSYDYAGKAPKEFPSFDLTFDSYEFKALDPSFSPKKADE